MRQPNPYRSSKAGYMHGSAAPSLTPSSGFEVIPGRREDSEAEALPDYVFGIAKTIVAVALVVAALCCVRVALSAASITTSIEANELSARIETARSHGSDLEVQQSRLSNSTHIRIEAAGLGMTPPVDTVPVVLGPDVVVTDAQGNLSLSGSIAALSGQE